VQLDALLAQHMFRYQQIFPFRVSSQGDYVRVFAQQQHILDSLSLSRGCQALLQSKGIGVRDEAQVGDKQGIHWEMLF